jgi:thiamine biosynthesis lipoprotein
MAGTPATHFESRAMGSPLRLTLGGGRTHADAGATMWQAVLDEFEAAEEAMSRFRDSSEVTILNRGAGAGATTRPSRRLRQALVAADRAHRMTGGRFDPRVLADLDRLGYRGAPLGEGEGTARGPRPADPAEPVVRRIGRDEVTVAVPVDLGGIGKGLTLRWAAGLLDGLGATDYLLDAGGDLVARGQSPEGRAWQLGIEDPEGSPDPLAVIAVSGMAVATSSIRVNRWVVDGRPVHHLLDPRTGEPAEGGLASVTVAGTDPAWSEVWSKVLFLCGQDGIASEARSRGSAGWWIGLDGTLEMTAAARALTIWVAAEAV